MFLIRVYLRAWFTASLAASAPCNDLAFIQSLTSYDNAALVKVAAHKFSGDLWYLSEELVGLAFYDHKLSFNAKRAMARAITEREGVDDPPKRIQVDVRKCDGMSIDEFVTKNRMVFFRRIAISSDFLTKDPELWADDDDYKKGLEIVTHLKIVNDNAERGVALIQEYNTIMTRKESQKQYLLQVVQEHRGQFPNCMKESLSADQ